MRGYFSALMMAVMTLGTGSAMAQDNPVVVELFTSQGCSSCPPADAMFKELAQMDGVVALSLHVDYWDYIGWKDSFGQPAFTERQQAYARAAGEHTVYTPQFVVGGLDPVIGADAMAVMEQVRLHAAAQSGIVVQLVRDGASLNIRADARDDVAQPLLVQVIRYIPEESVSIESGENAGHRLSYVNIVTSWDVVGRWDTSAPLALTVPLPGDGPAVVIVQEEGPGRIMAAAVLR